MVVEKVTRDHIRSIPLGEIGLFTLPNRTAYHTAQVQFCSVKRTYGLEFEFIKTNDPLTLAYRRTK